MTDRTVKVRLTAEARSLKDELKASTLEAERLKAAGGEINTELRQLSARADKAGVSLLKLAADGKLTGDALKSADRQVSELNRDLEKLGATRGTGATGTVASLGAEIERTKTRIGDLRSEFMRTGSASSLAGLKQAEKELRSLEAAALDVKKIVAQSGLVGQLAGNKLVASAGEALGGVSGIWSVAGPLLVSAAPVIGAEIGAALLLGVGLAGIAAGIAGQLHDPVVVHAAQALGKDVSTQFKNATASFQVPTIAAIHLIDAEVDKLGPRLKTTLGQLAPLAANLGQGVAGFIDKLAPGLEHAAVASKPLIELFSARLPDLGRAIGNVFDEAANNSTEAAQALNLLLNVVQAVISELAPTTYLLSKAFDVAKFTGVLGVLTDIGHKGGDSGDQLQQAFKGASDALKNFTGTAGGASTAVVDLDQKMTQLFNDTMALDQATGNWTHDLANLKAQLDLHDRKLNEATDAGHKNADALRNMAQEAERVREATIAAAGGQNASAAAIDAANAKYRAQIGQLEALAGKLGLSKDAVQALLDKYRALINAPNLVKIVKIVYQQSGNGYVQTSGGKAAFAQGGVMIPAASGLAYGAGIYPASNPPLIKFAEPQTRGETLIPNYGIPAAKGLALADYAASHYGGRVTGGRGGAVQIDITVRDDSGRMLTVIRREVTQKFGGDVQLALGRTSR